MLQNDCVFSIEIYPDFNSIEGLCVFGGDESESIDVLGVIEVLSNQVEDEIWVDFVFVFLVFADGEDEATSILIFRVFPFGFDAFFEVLDWVDFAIFISDVEAEWRWVYVLCLLLFCRK